MKTPQSAHRFNDAVLRLTVLYVWCIAVVCMIFSIALYSSASQEIDNGLRRQVVGFRGLYGRTFVDERATEIQRELQSDIAHRNLRGRLVFTNIVVIALSSGVSFWFARRTLAPLAENLKRQERFTADASHELRTPLAVMQSEIEVALRGKELDPEDARAVLQSNLEEIHRLSTMVSQLLSLARSGELAEMTEVQPRALVQSICDSAEKSHPHAQLILVGKFPKKIQTYSSVVDHVVRSLVDNALKYGGDAVLVSINARIVDGQLSVNVSDNGPGISAHDQAHIFERFYRVDKSRTKHQEQHSHGLGLAIAHQLAQKSGGSLSVQSTLGKGSTFCLRVPCK